MTSARGDISPGKYGRSAKRRPSRANTKKPAETGRGRAQRDLSTVPALTNPAPRGIVNGATLSVQTNQPGATCIPLVYDLPPAPGQPSKAGGLGPQTTDAAGKATWTWTVEPAALVGTAQVQVTCSYQALLGYAFTSTTIS
jgi:hypothetical protein